METEIRVSSQTTLCFAPEGFCLSVELWTKEGRHSSHRLLSPEGEAGGWRREAKDLEPFEEVFCGASLQEPEQ